MNLLEKLWNVIVGFGWKSPMVTVSIPLPTGYTRAGSEIEMRPSDTLVLVRKTFTDLSTIGQFLIDDDVFCQSLELSCRKANPLGKLAINSGKYEVVLGDKPITPLELHFGFPLPTLLNVPNRTMIHIHPANWPQELEGCIAPGFRSDIDAIYDSRNAYFKLASEIHKRLQMGKFYLCIVGGI